MGLQSGQKGRRGLVINRISLFCQLLRIMAHGAEKQHQLLALVGQPPRAGLALYQENAHVGLAHRCRRRRQRRMVSQQLVT
jgi:hypothetical protein